MTCDYSIPPHSVEAEQSLLGGVMIDSGSERSLKAIGLLTESDFYNHNHRVIFNCIKSLMNQMKPVDMLTVYEALKSSDLDVQAGGFAYLAQLSKSTPTSANIVHYAMIIRDKSRERFALEQTSLMIEVLTSQSGMSTAEKLEAVQALSMKIDDKGRVSSRGAVQFSEAFDRWADAVNSRLSGESGSVGLSTGIKALDAMLAPKRLVKGSLFVIGARPKMGKTTLYTKLFLNCAINENLPAVAFSLEMTEQQLVERALSQHARVSSNIFYLDGYDDNKFAMASAKGMEIANSGNVYIDDSPNISLSHIVSESRRIKRERGVVGMILVDYLTLMKAEKAERNDLAYGLITKSLKQLAKELNCVVVLLTQLNRNLEQRADKRPFPADSRDTGQIEQDCDYWLGIYRDGAYNEHVDQSKTELLLRLNRHGETGTVFIEQRGGVIYEVDQDKARMELASRQEMSSKQYKNGGY